MTSISVQIAPLLIITFVYWRACKPVFEKPMSVLSLRTAVDMDHNDKYAALFALACSDQMLYNLNPSPSKMLFCPKSCFLVEHLENLSCTCKNTRGLFRLPSNILLAVHRGSLQEGCCAILYCQLIHLPIQVAIKRIPIQNKRALSRRVTAGDVSLDGSDPKAGKTYLMPAMDFDEAKHDSALQEAAEMEQVLQGKKVAPCLLKITTVDSR